MRIKRLNILMLVSLLLAPLTAWSIELDAAKNQGLVGEQANGYLGIVATAPSGEVQALVTDVNGKRKAQYLRIAKKNGIALTDVEALAGEKTLAKTQSGNFIKPASGGWRKK